MTTSTVSPQYNKQRHRKVKKSRCFQNSLLSVFLLLLLLMRVKDLALLRLLETIEIEDKER